MLTLVLVQTLCFFAFHRSFAVKTEKSCDSVTPRAQDCKFGLETLYVFIRKQIAIICHVQQMTPPASARRAISKPLHAYAEHAYFRDLSGLPRTFSGSSIITKSYGHDPLNQLNFLPSSFTRCRTSYFAQLRRTN